MKIPATTHTLCYLSILSLSLTTDSFSKWRNISSLSFQPFHISRIVMFLPQVESILKITVFVEILSSGEAIDEGKVLQDSLQTLLDMKLSYG